MAALLVVDDDPDLLILMAAHYGARGHAVVGARSCEDAESCIAVRPPDLVLLDFCLPKTDGTRLIEVLRADAATKLTPVIVMTAAARSWIEKKLPADPLVRLVEKPFDFSQVDPLVDELLGAPRA